MQKALLVALVIVLGGITGVAVWVLREPASMSKSPSSTALTSATTTALPDTVTATIESDSQAASTTAEPTNSAESAFSSEVRVLSSTEKTFMTGKSWNKGCPVLLSELRAVTMTHWDWNGVAVGGTLILHKDVVDSALAAFQRLYEIKYPIRLMEPIDEYRSGDGVWADDSTSIDANNTSAFNCRPVTGGSGWSEHAYGRAIDINPVENPYVLDRRVARASSEPFIERKLGKGVLLEGDRAVQAFVDHGWQWGGLWANPIDYQHFSTSGR